MDFIVNLIGKLVWLVAIPHNWLLLLAAMSLVAVWRGRLGAARRWTGATLGALLVLTVLPVGDFFLARIEREYPANPDLTGVQGIIVLGGGEDVEATLRYDQVQLNAGGERLGQAVVLARQNPDWTVLYTGGGGALRDLGQTRSESLVAARFLTEMGLAPERIILEPKARNTTENARLSAQLVDPGARWVLITSAFHMPRAVASFERAGWADLVPYPVDFNARPLRLGWNLVVQLDLLTLAVHEYVGRFAYWILGR